MIRADLLAYLMDQSSVTDLIGTRMTLSRIPIDVYGVPMSGPYPCVSYRRTSAGHHHNLDGSQGCCEADFEFDVWGDDTEEVEAVGEAIRLKLQGFVGTMGSGPGTTVFKVTLINEQDFFHPPQDGSDGGIHRTTFSYNIGFDVAIPTY